MGYNRSTILMEPIRILTITLLSLLLPLSFLLLARLSSYSRFFAAQVTQPPFTTAYFLFFLNPAIIYAVVWLITVATLINSLTGKIGRARPCSTRARLLIAWILLCLLQVSVRLDVEENLGFESAILREQDALGGSDEVYGNKRITSMLIKTIFFLGLHEILLLWFRSIVKPVVDDAVSGGEPKEEKLVERVPVVVSFGTFWWWKLRNEVEGLIVIGEGKHDIFMGSADVAGFLCWWLYYLTVTIGIVRIIRGLLHFGLILLFERPTKDFSHNCTDSGFEDNINIEV